MSDQEETEFESPKYVRTDSGEVRKAAVRDLNTQLTRSNSIMVPVPLPFVETDKKLANLLDNNQQWARALSEHRPDFFATLAKAQKPKIAWFGCSDSRVPAETIVQLGPGDIFVHRNIANQVNHTDLNALSVLQYAVEHLKVEHVIVCGHYGCGGVISSMSNDQHGIVDNWLLNIKDICFKNHGEVYKHAKEEDRISALVELNVQHQVANVASTTIVQGAWAAGRNLEVHGWVYDLKTGLLKDLNINIGKPADLPDIYKIHFPGLLGKAAHLLGAR